MTDNDLTGDDYYHDPPLIGYVRELDETTTYVASDGSTHEGPDHEFICRGCWDDTDLTAGENEDAAYVYDQHAFGMAIPYPECGRCNDILTPTWEDALE